MKVMNPTTDMKIAFRKYDEVQQNNQTAVDCNRIREFCERIKKLHQNAVEHERSNANSEKQKN